MCSHAIDTAKLFALADVRPVHEYMQLLSTSHIVLQEANRLQTVFAISHMLTARMSRSIDATLLLRQLSISCVRVKRLSAAGRFCSVCTTN